MKNSSIILSKAGDIYRILDGNHRMSAIKRYNESVDEASKTEYWSDCFVLDGEPGLADICDLVEIVCSETILTQTEFTFPNVLRNGRLILRGRKPYFDKFGTKKEADAEGVRFVSKKLGLKVNSCMKEIRRFAELPDEHFNPIYAKLKDKAMPWDKDFWKPFIVHYEQSTCQVMDYFYKYSENTLIAREQWKKDMKACYWEILPAFAHYGIHYHSEDDIINKLTWLESVE